MHLRLPIVAGIVALAACGAVLRAHVTSDPSPSAPTLRTDTARTDLATESPGASGRRRIRAARSASARGETIVVYVAGEVAHAGLYTLPEKSRAADAVRAAGGARPNADLVALNLAAPLGDGDEVAVSARGADAPPVRRRTHRRTSSASVVAAGDASATPTHHRKKRRSHRRHAAANPAAADSADAAEGDGPTEIVDLNTADAMELETLPGIGATLAERIVAFRDAGGPFASPDDLLDVGGMTQGKLDTVLPFVVVR